MLTVLLLGMTLSQAPRRQQCRVRKTAYARMPRRADRSPPIPRSCPVVARNAGPRERRPDPPARRQDWKANPHFAPAQATSGKRLRAQAPRSCTGPDTFIVEALLMDHQGALVCTHGRAPEDYWQGDEPKWARTYGEGGNGVRGRPHLDVNTDKYGISSRCSCEATDDRCPDPDPQVPRALQAVGLRREHAVHRCPARTRRCG